MVVSNQKDEWMIGVKCRRRRNTWRRATERDTGSCRGHRAFFVNFNQRGVFDGVNEQGTFGSHTREVSPARTKGVWHSQGR
jgi:FPC/CPF motif-containing protein YcgG